MQLEEVGTLPRVQTRLRRTWDNLLSGLADTFTVIKLSTRLASYLGVGEQTSEYVMGCTAVLSCRLAVEHLAASQQPLPISASVAFMVVVRPQLANRW